MKGFLSSVAMRFLSLLFGLAILIFLLTKVGIQDFFSHLAGISIPLLLFAVLVYAFSWLFRSWRLKDIVRMFDDRISLFSLFKMQVGSFAINAIMPAKAGDVALILMFKNKGLRIGTSGAVVIQNRILDVLAIISLLLPMIYLIGAQDARGYSLTSLWICFMVMFLPILFVFLDKEKKFVRMLELLEGKISHKLSKLAALKTKEAYESYHAIVFDKSLFILTLIQSMLIWLLEGLVCWVLALALGVYAFPWEFLIAVAIANIGKSVPVTPGGIGIYEGFLAAVLAGFGIPFEVAVVIAICDHILKKLFNLSFGFLFLPELGIEIKQLKKDIK